MRALVTGGAGFIGSNLVDALLDRGDEVTSSTTWSTGKRENLDGALARGARFDEADIRDAGRMRSVFAAARPDIVFHLAAQIDVRKSIEDPAWDAGINVVGTDQRARGRAPGRRQARGQHLDRRRHLRRGRRHARRPRAPPPRPMAAYGQSKFCAEAYCGWYERLYGLSSVTLRYGNVYGPRQDPHGEAGVIAIFCGKLLAGETPPIFGDGRQTRDYIYVGDIVAANLAAAAHPEAHGAYNVGTGTESTVHRRARRAARRRGAGRGELEPEFAPARRASCSAARST